MTEVKYDKGTIGWLREQAQKDGFDDLGKWNQWKRNRNTITQENIKNKICNNCNKRGTEIESYREINREGKFTGKWVCKICYNYKLKHGEYKNYHGSPGWFNELLEKYGKDFADWAFKNKDRVPGHWLIAGCKTNKEYRDKNAIEAGFKNRQDREDYNAQLLGYQDESSRYGWNIRKTKEYQDQMKKRREFRKTKDYRDTKAKERGFKDDTERRSVQRWNNGDVTPVEDYEECESHIGCIIGEDNIGKPILEIIFEYIEKKKFNNPGYDFLCKNPRNDFLGRYPQIKMEQNKEYRIDIKTSHFLCGYWKYRIDYNNLSDYFLQIGLDTIRNIPYHILLVHKDDIIRGKKFWERSAITIGKNYLSEFSKYNLNFELEEFKRNRGANA